MRTQQVLDGVNLGKMDKLTDELKGDHNLAKFKFRVSNKWVDGAHCKSIIRSFYGHGQEDFSRSHSFVLEADEPDILLGRDHGPNATEALLHSLAACLNTTFICHAADRGIEINQLELDLEGQIDLRGFLDFDDETKRGFQDIRVTIKAKSTASPEELQQLCELAKKNSPVFNMITNPTPVSVELKT